MAQRKFPDLKALIDYAEQNGLAYLWQDVKRGPSVSAFAKRQQMLSSDQFEIVNVRTRYRVRRAMLFPKSILQAEFEADRDVLATKRERWRAQRAAKQRPTRPGR
jgi:hypothetical protein